MELINNIFRYGKALAQLGDYDKAMESLLKAQALIPTCDEIRSQIQEVIYCNLFAF